MEPERQIEKLLRAVAKKRRDQAGEPLELHPVARQELLREVSGRAAQEKGGSVFSNLLLFVRRPRVALVFCVVVVAVVGGWLVVPHLTREPSAGSLVAANTLGIAPMDRKKALPAAAPSTPAPAPVLSDNPSPATPTFSSRVATSPPAPPGTGASPRSTVQVATLHSEPVVASAANRQLAVTSPQPANAPEGAVVQPNLTGARAAHSVQPAISGASQQLSAQAATSFDNAVANNGIAAGSAGSATKAATAPMTLASANSAADKSSPAQNVKDSFLTTQSATFAPSLKDRSGASLSPISQNFKRVVTVAPATRQGFGGGGGTGGGLRPVLTSFQMQQNGQQLRVVDADGSVYVGSWQLTNFETADVHATAPAASMADGVVTARRAEAELQAKPPSAGNYFFQVAGTNVNLRQNIVFSGTFIPLTNRANVPAAGGGGGTVPASANALDTMSQPPLLLNSRITGRVVIGNRRPIELNAMPTR